MTDDDNLLDYLKLASWRTSELNDRNVKAAIKWAEQVGKDYGRCNAARAKLKEVES